MFRWYNTTYAFNAITIILYALVSRLHKGSKQELLEDVEKSLKIFQAMDGIVVARRCAELIQEIFEVAKMSAEDQRHSIQLTAVDNTNTRPSNRDGQPTPDAVVSQQYSSDWGNFQGFDDFQEDFFASLVDPNILDTVGANLTDLDLDFPFPESFDGL